MLKRELPILVHGGNAERLSAEFDYDDMVALSGLFRLWALYSAKLSPEYRTELIGYSADFEALAHWAGEGWLAADPSGAMPVFKLLASRARNRSSVVRLEHAKHWLGRTLHQNERRVNRLALEWLEEANARLDPSHLHLLTLAQWGLRNRAQGDWPEDLGETFVMQLEDLATWTPVDLMKWLFSCLDEGNPHEQEQALMHDLKTAYSPQHAAELVLDKIWYTILVSAAAGEPSFEDGTGHTRSISRQ